MAALSISVHPAALRVPEMDAKTYAEFKADIEARGLLDPIQVLPDGSLIDGRHRERACRELGITPRYETVNPKDPLAYVLSKNKKRRQLKSQQLAALGVLEKRHYQEAAKERQRAGGNKTGVGRKKVSGPLTVAERIADAYGTNQQYVKHAMRIHAQDPETFELLLAGKLTMNEAVARCAKKTDNPGKRAQQRGKAASDRVNKVLGYIEGVAEFCEKVSVDVIRRDERLHRQWNDACRAAIKALRGSLQRLRGEVP